MLVQLVRRPAADLHRAQTPAGVEIPAGVAAADPARHVGEDHDGKLEPLCLVHRHQPDAVAALFENRRLAPSDFRRLAQLVDEPAERNAAARFVLPRQLGDVQHVGERLLARGTQDEADVRSRFREQPADRVGNGPVVAPAMQLLQQTQRVGDRRQVRRWFAAERELAAGVAPELLRNPERMERCRTGVGTRAAARRRSRRATPLSVAKTDSSSSGHSMAASAARIVSTSSRP